MQDNEPLDFAAMLDWYRHRARLNLHELATAGNIPFYTIRNWAWGATLPSEWRDVVLLARALKLSEAEAGPFLIAAGHHTRVSCWQTSAPLTLV